MEIVSEGGREREREMERKQRERDRDRQRQRQTNKGIERRIDKDRCTKRDRGSE